MCFSAPASFIASGGLAALGGTSLAVAKKEDKILAAIPLMFAVQQGLEGIQWLYLNSGSLSLLAGYGYLFFALILWPIYVPIFVFVLDKKRRGILAWFIVLGVAVGLYYLIEMLTQSLAIEKINACINYNFSSIGPLSNSSLFGYMAITAYLVTVFGSLLVSSKPVFKWLSGVIALLALISWYFFAVAFTSVWCFFAAIVSSLFFAYIVFNNRSKSKIVR